MLMVITGDLPQFSVIVGVADLSAHLLHITLQSVTDQVFYPFEVILIDGRTELPNNDILDQYREHIATIHHLPGEPLFALFTKGLSFARGEYVHFLASGEYYMTSNAFALIANFVKENHFPDCVQTGWIERYEDEQPKVFFHEVDAQDLKGGTVLGGCQAYWFRREMLSRIGGFDLHYKVEGGFDLITRILLDQQVRLKYFSRILTDYEYKHFLPKRVVIKFLESFSIIHRHFGWGKALLFWFNQSQLDFFKWLLRGLRNTFWFPTHR